VPLPQQNLTITLALPGPQGHQVLPLLLQVGATDSDKLNTCTCKANPTINKWKDVVRSCSTSLVLNETQKSTQRC